MPLSPPPWHALQVRANFERHVATALHAKGYIEFAALYRAQRKWADRLKESERPLFPGYVFCRFDPKERLLPILTTPGVLAIVGAGSSPISIPDEEITAIQAIVRSGRPLKPTPFIDVGCRITIGTGALAGIEGVVIREGSKYRLVVSVELLRRSVLVDVDRDAVSPVLDLISK